MRASPLTNRTTFLDIGGTTHAHVGYVHTNLPDLYRVLVIPNIRRHKQFGHLFSGRYKALIVEGSGNGYLKTVCDYVHLNPARAKVLKPEQALSDFVWSSYPQYLRAPSRRPCWLRVDRLMGEWGIPKDSKAGRRVFAERMEWRRGQDLRGEFRRVERGWCLGGEAFRQQPLEQVETRPGRAILGRQCRRRRWCRPSGGWPRV